MRHGGFLAAGRHYRARLQVFTRSFLPERAPFQAQQAAGLHMSSASQAIKDEYTFYQFAKEVLKLKSPLWLREFELLQGEAARQQAQPSDAPPQSTSHRYRPIKMEFDPGPFLVVKRNKFFTGGFEPQMTIDEASMILGISFDEALDQKKLTAAHRRVMLRNHPDRGGSPYLATKINEAKDLLLASNTEIMTMKKKRDKERENAEREEEHARTRRKDM